MEQPPSHIPEQFKYKYPNAKNTHPQKTTTINTPSIQPNINNQIP